MIIILADVNYAIYNQIYYKVISMFRGKVIYPEKGKVDYPQKQNMKMNKALFGTIYGTPKRSFFIFILQEINLVNTGIREYLVSKVIFLIPRFIRVYSFLGSCFWEDNLLCLFYGKNDNPVCLWTYRKRPKTVFGNRGDLGEMLINGQFSVLLPSPKIKPFWENYTFLG